MPAPKKHESKIQRKKRMGILGLDVALAKRGLLGKGYASLKNKEAEKKRQVLYRIAEIEGTTW